MHYRLTGHRVRRQAPCNMLQTGTEEVQNGAMLRAATGMAPTAHCATMRRTKPLVVACPLVDISRAACCDLHMHALKRSVLYLDVTGATHSQLQSLTGLELVGPRHAFAIAHSFTAEACCTFSTTIVCWLAHEDPALLHLQSGQAPPRQRIHAGDVLRCLLLSASLEACHCSNVAAAVELSTALAGLQCH